MAVPSQAQPSANRVTSNAWSRTPRRPWAGCAPRCGTSAIVALPTSELPPGARDPGDHHRLRLVARHPGADGRSRLLSARERQLVPAAPAAPEAPESRFDTPEMEVLARRRCGQGRQACGDAALSIGATRANHPPELAAQLPTVSAQCHRLGEADAGWTAPAQVPTRWVPTGHRPTSLRP